MTEQFKTTDKAVQAEQRQQQPRWKRVLLWLIALGTMGAVGGVILVFLILAYFSTQIPSIEILEDYKPSLVTKIYDKEGQILAEYAKERRIWIPIKDIPPELIQAYLAAEDTNFYTHGGYNPKAILRAAITNVLTGRKHGASTITQQVAKTYLLSSERTYTRKIKELLISRRIEKAFSKDQILELYLNRIYLGNGAYGVASAAQTYFSKTLPELNLGERALLAGLPKAPSRYDPANNPNRAKLRRDIIIRRMQTEEFISKETADATVRSPIKLKPQLRTSDVKAPHFAEYIRRQILADHGEDNLYEGGLAVYTTLDSQLQNYASAAIENGLIDYDKRHGYRGAIGRMKLLVNWEDRLLTERRKNRHYTNFGQFAVVLEVTNGKATVGYLNAETRAPERGELPLSGAKWAREYKDVNTLGPEIKKLTQVLSKGDIILIKKKNNRWNLAQYPAAQAALVAIDVPTGAIRAMVGGTDAGTGFNRATQGERQAGSAFKPIIYASALEAGYTPATTVLDAPIVIRDGRQSWKPKNYSSKVYGPSPLRRGLERSLNLMTVRIAQDVGIPAIKNLAIRLGLPAENMGNNIGMSLGTAGFTLLDMTNAYATFARQGRTLKPHTLTRVQDASGATLATTHPTCHTCLAAWSADPFTPPQPVTIKSQEAVSPAIAYQMTSMLQGVFTRGTARKYNKHGPAVAGKTGTTDNAVDGWFVGFTPNLAVGVWFGFDSPKSTGKWESGGKLTLPIWSEFMRNAQNIIPRDKFSVPASINLVTIDTDSGKLPGPSTQTTHLEAFIPGTEPQDVTAAPTGGLTPSGQGDVPTFGIY